MTARAADAERPPAPLWRVIRGAAAANAVPALVLWAFAIGLAVAYGRLPAVAAALEPVARWQERTGFAAAFLSQFVFCGMVPCAFMLTVKSVATKRPVAKAFVQSLWCGTMGMVCWWFYGVQNRLFGTANDAATLLCKTAFDQFVWTAFFVSPLSAAFFVWLGCDFSWAAARRTFRRGFVRRVVLPNLVAGWCVWFPAAAAIYSFPRPIQIHMLSLTSSLWVMLCLQIGARSAAD